MTRGPRAPRLAALAARINAEFPAWEAVVEAEHASTDRPIRGTRLRHIGKGRDGNRLTVYRRHLPRYQREAVVYEHHSTDPYRRNQDVVEWLAWWLKQKAAWTEAIAEWQRTGGTPLA